jgi:hypothetical protein
MQCDSGYRRTVPTSAGGPDVCHANIASCITQDGATCSACDHGFLLQSNACHACAPGFTPSSDLASCHPNIPNCATQDGNRCTTCDAGYTAAGRDDHEGVGLQCLTNIANCATAYIGEDKVVCLTCSSGFTKEETLEETVHLFGTVYYLKV